MSHKNHKSGTSKWSNSKQPIIIPPSWFEPCTGTGPASRPIMVKKNKFGNLTATQIKDNLLKQYNYHNQLINDYIANQKIHFHIAQTSHLPHVSSQHYAKAAEYYEKSLKHLTTANNIIALYQSL
jgi:hypothetical protein